MPAAVHVRTHGHTRTAAGASCSGASVLPTAVPQHRQSGRQQALQPPAAVATVAEEVVPDPVQSEKSQIQQLLNR